jgi:sugar phosphate permease
MTEGFPGTKAIAPSVATSASYRWVAICVAWLAFAVAYMQRLSVGPLAPFLTKDLNLTRADVGWFMGSATLGYGITLLPAGYLVDRIGVRLTLFIGQTVAGCFLVSMYFANGLIMGLIVMFGAGLGLGFLSPSSTKAVVEWFSVKERAMAMGIKQTSVNVGGMITAAVLPIIGFSYGWRMGFVGMGVIAILSGLFALFVYKNPPHDETATGTGPGTDTKPVREKWTELFKSRDIWCISLGGMVLYIAEFGVITYFVLYLKSQLLISVISAGFLLASIDFGGLFGKPLSGILSDRVFKGKRKPVFILLAAISTIFTAIFAFMPVGTPQWLILVCSVIFGFAAVGWSGICSTMITEMAGKENAATTFGATSVLLVLGNVLGVPVFGYISDWTGGWNWSWLYLVFLGVLGTGALFFVREERRKLKV